MEGRGSDGSAWWSHLPHPQPIHCCADDAACIACTLATWVQPRGGGGGAISATHDAHLLIKHACVINVHAW